MVEEDTSEEIAESRPFMGIFDTPTIDYDLLGTKMPHFDEVKDIPTSEKDRTLHEDDDCIITAKSNSSGKPDYCYFVKNPDVDYSYFLEASDNEYNDNINIQWWGGPEGKEM